MGLIAVPEKLHLLDTNIVNKIDNGDAAVLKRLAQVRNIGVSSIVVEEMLIRGHVTELNNIRSGRSKASIERTSDQFVKAIAFLATFPLYPYTDTAELLFKTYRAARLKGMDGRIAAHAVTLGAVLVTENVRDFTGVAGLVVENWAEYRRCSPPRLRVKPSLIVRRTARVS